MNVMDTRATSALLYLDGVHVSFDGFHAINNLSLTLAPGEMRAIIGPNGAGKTTMMDIITGKTKPDEGEVLFDGVTDLTRLDETRIAELGIGRKFQKPTVFESQTIEDNLLLALNVDHSVKGTLFWRGSKPESERIEKVLETIRLTDARNRLAGSLSHGQKQWLEIGMLLAQDPKLLLVDEPVAGMTDVETHQTAELSEGNQQGKDRDGGRARHDLRPRTRRQGDLPARRRGAGGRHHRPGLVERARDRSVSGKVGAMLKVDNISLYYGAAQALRGVSIAAEPGKVTCVLGRNGVGKTSLLRAMVGQYPIASGSIVFDGADITALKPYERARKGIGFVPQGREIFPLLTVEENLKTGFGPLKREDRNIPDDVFSLFPVLQSMLGRRGGDLSGGQQQQLAIGRALVMRPKLLLLDEPTEGIQPSIIKDIGRAIQYLRSLGNIAIVLVEQYLDFACELGDNFAVMDRGAVKYACDRSAMDPAEISRQMAL